jgi:hypothetical protein
MSYSLKNVIKKIILKEADDYLQDFNSFDDEERKNRLRQYLTTKNLSNISIGPKSMTNFPNKGDELSLFSLNIRDLKPIERNILKQSLNNGNIQHKVENGIVSFSKKDINKLSDEIDKILEDEYENAQEEYLNYLFKHGELDRITGKIKENEMTKRYEKKLFSELEKVQKIINDLTQKIVNVYYNNYNDESLDEAYVDASGQLQDFNPSPYDMELDKGGVSPFYDPSLPRRNRMKAPDGGTYLKLILDEPYQKKAFRVALNIAVNKGAKSDFGNYKLPNFKFKKFGDTEVYEFNSKFSNLIKSIFNNIGKTNPVYKEIYDELTQMIH